MHKVLVNVPQKGFRGVVKKLTYSTPNLEVHNGELTSLGGLQFDFFGVKDRWPTDWTKYYSVSDTAYLDALVIPGYHHQDWEAEAAWLNNKLGERIRLKAFNLVYCCILAL